VFVAADFIYKLLSFTEISVYMFIDRFYRPTEIASEVMLCSGRYRLSNEFHEHKLFNLY